MAAVRKELIAALTKAEELKVELDMLMEGREETGPSTSIAF